MDARLQLDDVPALDDPPLVGCGPRPPLAAATGAPGSAASSPSTGQEVGFAATYGPDGLLAVDVVVIT